MSLDSNENYIEEADEWWKESNYTKCLYGVALSFDATEKHLESRQNCDSFVAMKLIERQRESVNSLCNKIVRFIFRTKGSTQIENFNETDVKLI